jgi:cell division FtsZ-interacting protein ZapD
MKTSSNPKRSSGDGIEKIIRKLSNIQRKLKHAVKSEEFDKSVVEELIPVFEKAMRSIEVEYEMKKMQNELSMAILVSEMKADLVDRDANDAKAMERQRIASERGEDFSSILIKNRERVSQIDTELSKTCPWFRTRVCKSLLVFESNA